MEFSEGNQLDNGRLKRPRKKPGRVPTSCAECRRLKLKCDRKVPCEKCVSRGCAQICPDGSLTPGKGNRMILANTKELHDQIEQYRFRIVELEAALKASHPPTSDQPHSLLHTDIQGMSETTISSTSNSPPSTRTDLSKFPPDTMSTKGTTEDSTIDAFGTLTIGQDGGSHFFGKTARSEYLIHATKHENHFAEVTSERPRDFAAHTYRGLSDMHPTLGQELYNSLPTSSEAAVLCDLYMEHGEYIYAPVTRPILNDVLHNVYQTRNNTFQDTMRDYHSLSLMFMVFALAVLLDVKKEPHSAEAQKYYSLAKISLELIPPARKTTLHAIQTLIHMAQFLEIIDWESREEESGWMYIGYAVRLGHSIGLHMSSSRWKLSPSDFGRRSCIFWQMFVADTWTSFCFGRPPSICLAYTDGALPDEFSKLTQENQCIPNYNIWVTSFSFFLNSIMSIAFGPNQPDYDIIMKIDKETRDFPVPEPWREVYNEKAEKPTQLLAMLRWQVLSAKESVLLNLHRAYFAQALHDSHSDLNKHRYFPSVIAIYRSAWRIGRALTLVFSGAPETISRISLAWSQGLSAAIVMCLLVTKAPTCQLAKSALAELELLTRLFSDASRISISAGRMLVFLKSLRGKAREALGQPQNGETLITPAELDRLSGKTHLISQVVPEGTSRRNISPSSHSMNIPDDIEMSIHVDLESFHPTIVKDIKSYLVGEPTEYIYNFNDIPTIPDNSFYPPPEFYQSPFSSSQHLTQKGTSDPRFESAQQQQFEEVVNPPVLDSTWHGFMEQLGF